VNQVLIKRSSKVPQQRLPTYVADRASRRARRRRRIAWTMLLIGAFFYGLLYAFLPPAFIPQLSAPLLLLGALVIWALPNQRAAPTRMLYWLFVGFYVSLICWPNYLALSLPGLPWITFLRLTGFPMSVLLLVCVSTSQTFRHELKAVLQATPAIWKALALFVGIQALSLVFSSHPVESINKFVIALVNWTAIFFTAAYVFRTPGRVTRWSFVLIAMALFVCAIGFWEWRIGRVPWAGRIPSFLSIDDENVERILAGGRRAATGLYRVQSTFTTSLSCAEFLAMTTPFIVHTIMVARRFYLRLFALACIPVVFFTIYNTNSRLGALGFFLSLLLYLAFWSVRRWKLTRESVFGPALTLAYPVIFVLFLTATMFVGRLHRMVWGGGETQFSTDARIAQWHAGLPMILQRPFGHGVGQAAEVLGFTNGDGVLTIDSYYLSIGLEYGVIGFIAYYGMFVAGLGYGTANLMKAKANDETLYLVPIVISLTVFLVVKSVLSQEANHPLAFMLLGMEVALISRCLRQAQQTQLPNPPVRDT
jgi:hypothetical protein